MSKMAIY